MVKNLTVTQEAYDYLKALKGKKSFSETILDLRGSTADILKYAGCFKGADLDSIRKIRAEANRDWNRRR